MLGLTGSTKSASSSAGKDNSFDELEHTSVAGQKTNDSQAPVGREELLTAMSSLLARAGIPVGMESKVSQHNVLQNI